LFAQNSQYKISNTFHVDGDYGWDYIAMDNVSHRLFISHGMIVQVMDVKTGSILGTIPDTKGAHGIALAYDQNKGFITSSGDTSVTVFELTSLNIITKFHTTGVGPDAIVYEKSTHKVFTFNGRSGNSTVIDATTNDVLGTIDLPGRPEFCVSDDNGKVFVNLEDKSKLSVINAATMKVEQTWDLAPGEGPSGLAIDNVNHILFSACDNKMMIILDALSGKIITTVPIGERVDAAGFDDGLKRAYSSNGEGTLTVVQESDPNNFTVLENVTTQKGARTMAIDQSTHSIYLPTAEFGEPPQPTQENPHPRPTIKPGSFVILEVSQLK